MMQKEKNIQIIIVKVMLSNKIKLISILTTLFLCGCSSKNISTYDSTFELQLKNNEINYALDSVYNETKGIFDDGKSVFVIKVDKTEGVETLDFKIFKKSSFGWYLRDSEETPYGYFIYKNIPIIVFGINCSYFYKQKKHFKNFEWLKPLPPLQNDLFIILPSFDPPTWKYKYVNKKLIRITE